MRKKVIGQKRMNQTGLWDHIQNVFEDLRELGEKENQLQIGQVMACTLRYRANKDNCSIHLQHTVAAHCRHLC